MTVEPSAIEKNAWPTERIAARSSAAAPVGFKVSGGVRSLDDAMIYLQLQAKILGPDSLTRARFRIGASALLDNLEAALGGDAAFSDTAGY
jgi:deoxyribose-phosphate aldolase